MTPADFQELRENPHAILGASVKVLAPAGDYEKDKPTSGPIDGLSKQSSDT